MILNILAAIFLALCVYAGVKDLRSLIIPNWLNLTIALLFLPAAWAAGLSLETFGWHVAAGAIAFVLGFALFAFGVIGGGDAKMVPGVLLWLGPGAALNFSLAMGLSGGVLAVFVIFARRKIPAANAPAAFKGTLENEGGIPYAIAIAIGAFVAAAGSPLLANLLKNFSVLN